MKTTPDHPDFTALALGEHIHGSPAQAVLDALRHSAAVRGEADAICAAGARLARGLKAGPALHLDDARREAIFTADPAAIRARFAAEEPALPPAPAASVRPARPWIYPTAAAAAVALAAVVVLRLLPGYTAPGRLRQAPVVTDGSGAAEEDPVPTGHILVTPVDPRPRDAIPSPRSRRPETPDVVNTPAQPIPPPGKGQDLSRPAAPPALARDIPPARPVLPSPPPAPPASSPPRDFASPPLLKRPN